MDEKIKTLLPDQQYTEYKVTKTERNRATDKSFEGRVNMASVIIIVFRTKQSPRRQRIKESFHTYEIIAGEYVVFPYLQLEFWSSLLFSFIKAPKMFLRKKKLKLNLTAHVLSRLNAARDAV